MAVHRRYLVFYRNLPGQDAVRIERVLHGARDLRRLLWPPILPPRPARGSTMPSCNQAPPDCDKVFMTKELKPGDKVDWGTSQGQTHGTVESKVTGTEKVKGHTAKASEHDPQYKVKSDKSGKEAIHKPEELKKH